MRVKLNAFTLLELLVAMAITGIVVSIAGLVFNILGKQFSDYKETSSSIASAFMLDNRLRSDILDASSIYRIDEKLIISKGENIVKYDLTRSYILRTASEITDTFPIAAENMKYSFMGETVDEGPVDEIYFESVIHEEQESFHFIKRYSASELLNKEHSGN